jgi:hypothetical protein
VKSNNGDCEQLQKVKWVKWIKIVKKKLVYLLSLNKLGVHKKGYLSNKHDFKVKQQIKGFKQQVIHYFNSH